MTKEETENKNCCTPKGQIKRYKDCVGCDRKPSDNFKHCNHHHELTDKHEIVDFGNGEFVANKEAIPL